MQLSWIFTTLLLFAFKASAQYTTSSSYDYTPPTEPPYPPPTSICYPTTVISTSLVPTTVTEVTTSILTIITQAPYGYDNSYIPPMKKKTGLIIGLVVGLVGLAIILLVAFLLFKRKPKPNPKTYGETTYGETATS